MVSGTPTLLLFQGSGVRAGQRPQRAKNDKIALLKMLPSEAGCPKDKSSEAVTGVVTVVVFNRDPLRFSLYDEVFFLF